jgi:RNA-directed DNA polymerase
LNSGESAPISASLDAETARPLFRLLRTKYDLANALGVEFDKHLVYYLYRLRTNARYRQFEINKRNGGKRIISAPATGLKTIQQRLSRLLYGVYQIRPPVHGYALGRGPSTNAEAHVRQRFVLNVDLEDFFGSINFGRVRGMFMAPPYTRPPEVATLLAQICCHENKLPQGAPTSPIISNMICSRMDGELKRLSKEHGCFYTRYCDDLTFSTMARQCTAYISDIATINIHMPVLRTTQSRRLVGSALPNSIPRYSTR